jgi:ribosome maturation factor RimP
MESNSSNDLKQLQGLQGKKVQINFVSPAQEEATVSGRLLSVTNDLIIIDGAVMKTQLNRKQVKIVSIDYVDEPESEAMMKLIIRRGKIKMTVDDWTQIGEMIEQGVTTGKNKPKGIDWELVSWCLMR